MRITRLKLVNFIGIKNGLGKNEIEIIFPKNGNIITTFSGKNGSGKSTLMSMLSPFKESFDDRKSLILPGKEGVKEIDYEHDGHEYKIKHIYGAKAASFLSEDGVELNENGGVRTFEELIKTKFKLAKDYFKIGKVGSNTENFIQFTTAQRKTYISSFVENVQKYIDAYKIVSEKAKLNEQQIKQISSDLKKLDDIETVLKKIEENEKSLADLESTISMLTGDIARIETDINNVSKTMSDINFLETKSLLQIKEQLLNKNYVINDKFDKEYKDVDITNCDDKINEIQAELTKLETEKSKYDHEFLTESTQLVTIDNDIIKTKAQLKGKTAIDLNVLSQNIENLKTQIESISNELSSNELGKELLKNEAKNLTYIDSFKNFMLTMLSYYSVLNDKTIDQAVRNVELFFKPDFGAVFNGYAKTIRDSISNNKELLETKNNEYSSKSANLDKLDILEKRPKECKIDTCPFIADALKYSNLPDELVNLEKSITGLKNTLALNEEQAEKLSDIRVAYTEIAKAFTTLAPRENIIYQYFINKYGRITTFMNIPMTELQGYYETVAAEAEYLVSKINDLNAAHTSYKIQDIQYQQSVESEKNRLYFENELVELKKEKQECEDKKNSLSESIQSYSDQITKITEVLQDYKDYKVSLTETDNLEKEVADLKNTISVYESASKLKTEKTTLKDQLSARLEQANKDKITVTNNITVLKASEININSLNDNMTKLQATFKDTDLVKQALNPKSGIPLIFIQSYLDGTESIANELLNIAYEGKFEIKFVPTASDFFIQVRSGENVIEDIKLASQGEISMTTISISLALIERALGDYNIVYLDEIDGPLDKDNRESFIHILDKQIEKLGLEQIFVISHNNAFEACAMNLVLLPGSTVEKDNDVYMQNKDIIYDATV